MSRTRRSFTTEYKVEAAHRVIDSGRTIAEVARELGVNKQVSEQEKDIAFLKKASAYFAASQPR
jgi:transposase